MEEYLDRSDYEGRRGESRHMTRSEVGFIDPRRLLDLPGARNEHELFEDSPMGAYTSERWTALVDSIAEEGVRDAVFVVVEPMFPIEPRRRGHAGPQIQEGNHRVRAAVEAGVPLIPVEIRYFGQAEREYDVIPDVPRRLEDTRIENAGTSGRLQRLTDDLEYGLASPEHGTFDLRLYERTDDPMRVSIGRVGGFVRPLGDDCKDYAKALEAQFPELSYWDAFMVYKSFLEPEYRGSGIGVLMYEALMAELFDRKGPIMFGPSLCYMPGATSFDARRVWESLARKYPHEGFHPRRLRSGETVIGPGVIAVLDRPELPRQANKYRTSSVPSKYVEGVARGKKGKRRKEVAKRSRKKSDDPAAYKPFRTDIDPSTGKPYKTRESKHTRRYRELYGKENAGSVAKVAKATGIPKKVLQEVYDRGLAAWRTGHRPGASQHGWALARVYSFVTGGPTWSSADKDLAKKARAAGFKLNRRKKNDGPVDFARMVDDWHEELFGHRAWNLGAHSFAERHNATLIDCGGARCVFDVGGGAVLKLPADEYAVKDNAQECARWDAMAPKERRHYAAVLDCDPRGDWVLMEMVRPMTYRESLRPDVHEQIQQLRENVDIVDFHVYNVGWRGDELVVLDYGERVQEPRYTFNPEVEIPPRKQNSRSPSILPVVDAWEDFLARNMPGQSPDYNDVAEAFAQNMGLPLLACGIGRCVFDLGNRTVLKLPWSHYGTEQNVQECARWERATSEEERHLASIYECDPRGSYLVMEYVEPMTWEQYAQHERRIEEIARELDIYDLHSDNVGLRDGDIVAIDYGESRSGNPEVSAEAVDELETRLLETYPLDILMLHGVADGEGVRVAGIRVEPLRQREGIGSQVMQEIVDWADANKVTLVLTPSGLGPGPSKAKLKRWYRTFGFVPNKGRRKDFRFMDTMIREPVDGRVANANRLFTREPGRSGDVRMQPPWAVVDRRDRFVDSCYGGLFDDLGDAEAEAALLDQWFPDRGPHGVVSHTQISPVLLDRWMRRSTQDFANTRRDRAIHGRRPWATIPRSFPDVWLPSFRRGNPSRDYQFWTDCVGMPGGRRAGELVRAIVDHPEQKQITYATFARHADLDQLREWDHPAMYRISAPDNWAISFHRSRLPSGQPTYYFKWSGIEHFFVEEEPDLELEIELIDERRRESNPLKQRLTRTP